jgi:hypothetical protein
MSRWLRLDAGAVRHPKVACLSDKNFRLWIQLLCLAAENRGFLGDERRLRRVLNRRLDHLSTGLYELVRIGLIDVIEGGLIPHDWEHYQMKSDISTERVREWRRKRNVSEPLHETAHDTKRDDTIQEKENTSLRDVKEKAPKKVLKRSQIQEEHEPDDREVEIATKAGMSALTLELEWHRFRAHHMAKGSLMANWTQAWVTWVTNWKTFGSKQVQSGGNRHESGRKESWRH